MILGIVGREALDDPKHERHDELMEWAPENSDPKDVPVADLILAVSDLVKTWNRQPRKRKGK